MSAVRSARASRKGKIPGNFMLKWQSSGTKPLVRRPMTACQSCRTAKVKCDGQRECDNCTNRGIVCVYIVSPPAAPQTSAGEGSTALDVSDATTTMPMDTTAYEHAFDGMANWTNGTGSQRLTDFDWGATDPNTNSDVFDLEPHQGASLDMFEASQLFSSLNCRCQEKLAVLTPQVKSAMQEKQLDQVVKVTQKVVDRCQDIVNCTDCQISCTDLICIMAVLQQTDTCFEYIATADLDSIITVNFGGHDIPINNPKLRAMLVTNIIQQTTVVLDAISNKGQSMLRALCPSTALAQANIGYLETVIRDFKNVLRTVADSVDETGSTRRLSAFSARPVVN